MSEVITEAVIEPTVEDVDTNQVIFRPRAFSPDREFSEMIVKINGVNFSIQWDGFAPLQPGVHK